MTGTVRVRTTGCRAGRASSERTVRDRRACRESEPMIAVAAPAMSFGVQLKLRRNFNSAALPVVSAFGSFGEPYPSRMPCGDRQKKSLYLAPRVLLSGPRAALRPRHPELHEPDPGSRQLPGGCRTAPDLRHRDLDRAAGGGSPGGPWRRGDDPPASAGFTVSTGGPDGPPPVVVTVDASEPHRLAAPQRPSRPPRRTQARRFRARPTPVPGRPAAAAPAHRGCAARSSARRLEPRRCRAGAARP